jgi:hypothetical protein
MTMTTNVNKLATDKDAGNMVTTEAAEQETPRQVVPEQSLAGTLSKGQVLEANQSMPKQTTATTSSTQGGMPDAVARGKSAATSSTTGLNQEQMQAGAEQATEFDDDIIEEI